MPRLYIRKQLEKSAAANSLILTDTNKEAGYYSISTLISANSPNQLTSGSDGKLYVAAGGGLTVTDTNSVQLVLNTANLSANIKLADTSLAITTSGLQANINGDADNILTSTATGLKVQDFTVTDSSSIDFTKAGRDITGVVKLSATAGNSLSVNADGLYANISGSETQFTANDSNSIDFTTSGLSNHTLTGSVKRADASIAETASGIKVGIDGNSLTTTANGLQVKIDPVAGNKLTETTAGLKVIETLTSITYDSGTKTITYTDEGGTANNLDLSALAADIYVNGGTYDAATMTLTLTDNNGTSPDVTISLQDLKKTETQNSNSITLAGTGESSSKLTANLVVDPATNNILTVSAAGVLVPKGAGTTVTDTNSVDLTLASGDISAAVKRADASIAETASGIKVSLENNSLALGATGIKANISSTAGNSLSLDANGLYVAAGAGFTVTDTSTVDLTKTGGDIQAAVKISATSGNAITVNADGIYANSRVLAKEYFGSLTTGNTVTTTGTPLAGSEIMVYRNGMLMEVTVDYTIAGSVITFVDGFASSTGGAGAEEVKVVYMKNA